MKKMLDIHILFVVCLFIVLVSCVNKTKSKEQVVDNKSVETKDIKESLEKANRYLLVQEAEQIDDYIERHDMNVIQTGTG